MFHVFIRAVIAVVWLAAAFVSGKWGNNIVQAMIYIVLSGAFLYSSYVTWKKEKSRKG